MEGKLKSWAIVFAVLVVALVGTNPAQDEYVSWLKQQATNEVPGDQFGKALMVILGGPILNFGTTREDFFLFSIYHTDFTPTWEPELRSTPIRLTHTPTRCRVIPVAGKKLDIGRRLCVASDTEQRTEAVERVEAPVEPKREFVEVGL